jgi:hypothetical protein
MIRITITAAAFDAIAARDEDLSAVIVRLFGEQANVQIAELLGVEQDPSDEVSK